MEWVGDLTHGVRRILRDGWWVEGGSVEYLPGMQPDGDAPLAPDLQ